jgi:hypothetical protein
MPQHHAAHHRRGGVVQVHDGARRALQRLEGALDQWLARLRQHLDGHVVGDQPLVDQLAHEVELGLRRRRKADLDLLEADLHQHLEHAQLARRVHRLDQRLVAVAQVDAAPQRRRVITASGQVRSVRRTGAKGRYLVAGCFNIGMVP